MDGAMRKSPVLCVLALAVTGLILMPSAASATWPGANGKIYFSCRPPSVGFAGQDICVVNPDGSGFANLTNTPSLAENTPEPSRDGSQVVFTRGSGSTFVAWAMNADGSNQHQVTTNEADGPDWTPDGRVSYRAKVGSSYEFQTISAAGGGSPSTLLSAGVTGSSFSPRFRPDGTWLYGNFAEIPPATGTFTQQIYTVDDGGQTELTHATAGINSNQQPSWSPDGGKILFWRTTGLGDDIWIIPSSGGSASKLTTSADSVKEAWPSFSPDGAKLIWDQYDTTVPSNDFFHKKLVIADADGSNPTAVPTPALDYAATPAWSPAASAPPPEGTGASFDATAPRKVKKGKSIRVTLKCTGDTQCVVAYGATLSIPGKGKKFKTVKIKTRTATMLAKSTRSVTIAIPSSAKSKLARALKAGKKPTITVVATARQPNNGPQIRKVTMTVRIVG